MTKNDKDKEKEKLPEYAPWKGYADEPAPAAPAPADPGKAAAPEAPAPEAPAATPSWPPTESFTKPATKHPKPAKPAATPPAPAPSTTWPPTDTPSAPAKPAPAKPPVRPEPVEGPPAAPAPAPIAKPAKPAPRPRASDEARLAHLIEKNKAWAKRVTTEDPAFFQRLAAVQSPKYLWIGCSDSRVPANEIVDMLPGEMFVHRNVANLVVHTDLNCLAVVQYALDVLKIQHIIVCGHYNCGGVNAVVSKLELGLADTWLKHLADIEEKHATDLAALSSDIDRVKSLCELNVVEQVLNLAEATIVKSVWKRKIPLSIHGWIYGLENGLIRDLLENPISSTADATYLAKLLGGKK